jgi:hypothetical protein
MEVSKRHSHPKEHRERGNLEYRKKRMRKGLSQTKDCKGRYKLEYKQKAYGALTN